MAITQSAIEIAQSQVTGLTTALAAKAPIASPTFTGTPAAPQPTFFDNSSRIATTNYVNVSTVMKNPSASLGTSDQTITGTLNVYSPTAAGSIGVRQVTMSTAAPTGGSDGDMWLVYA